MSKNYSDKRYSDIKALNKTIENNNRLEYITDYILKHYIDLNGEVPNYDFLIKELSNMRKWLFKDYEFIKMLKTAISHLNVVRLDVYLEAMEIKLY